MGAGADVGGRPALPLVRGPQARRPWAVCALALVRSPLGRGGLGAAQRARRVEGASSPPRRHHPPVTVPSRRGRASRRRHHRRLGRQSEGTAEEAPGSRPASAAAVAEPKVGLLGSDSRDLSSFVRPPHSAQSSGEFSASRLWRLAPRLVLGTRSEFAHFLRSVSATCSSPLLAPLPRGATPRLNLLGLSRCPIPRCGTQAPLAQPACGPPSDFRRDACWANYHTLSGPH